MRSRDSNGVLAGRTVLSPPCHGWRSANLPAETAAARAVRSSHSNRFRLFYFCCRVIFFDASGPFRMLPRFVFARASLLVMHLHKRCIPRPASPIGVRLFLAGLKSCWRSSRGKPVRTSRVSSTRSARSGTKNGRGELYVVFQPSLGFWHEIRSRCNSSSPPPISPPVTKTSAVL